MLQSLDTLGAGFQLASHDLDIRGAGNLLGDEQSGHIKEVGYELYQQMLEEAVMSLKAGISRAGRRQMVAADHHRHAGAASRRTTSPTCRCGSRSTAGCPRSRTTATSTPSPPNWSTASARCREEVEYLLQVVAIKALCRRANVEKIEVGPKGAVLAFRDNIFANPEGLIAYIAKHPEGARVRPDMKVVFFDEWETPAERLKGAAGILRALAGIAEKAEKAA